MKRSIKRWNLKDFCDSRSRSNGSRACRMRRNEKDADKTTEINVGYFNNVTHAQALYMKVQELSTKHLMEKQK